ncbi:MAG: hypothetical protein JKY96_02285 [Phycisphaerales bacterium]|nr:hypothetical protein [Phycisphaerales bacterium]
MSILKRLTKAISEWYESHKNFSEAFIETVLVVIFSTIPIWLFPIFSPTIFKIDDSFLAQVIQNISQGELFLYSVAMLGPIFYATSYKYAEIKTKDGTSKFSISVNLQFGRTLFMVSTLLALVFGAIYGSMRLNIASGSPLEINTNGTVFSSLLAYGFSSLLFLITSWVKNQLGDGGASAMRYDESAFLKRYFAGKK